MQINDMAFSWELKPVVLCVSQACVYFSLSEEEQQKNVPIRQDNGCSSSQNTDTLIEKIRQESIKRTEKMISTLKNQCSQVELKEVQSLEQELDRLRNKPFFVEENQKGLPIDQKICSIQARLYRLAKGVKNK